MLRYLPPFITSNLQSGNLQGELNAFVMECGIANFARISAQQQKRGRSGAEELAGLLSSLWQVTSQAIQRQGGFVASSSGETILALFPQPNPQRVLAAMDEIKSSGGSLRKLAQNQGATQPRIRLLLGYGRIGWQVFANELQYEYLFSGRELEAFGLLRQKRESVLLTPAATRKLKSQGLLDGQGKPLWSSKAGKIPSPQQVKPIDLAVMERFEHPRFHNLEPETAFRQVVCNYIILSWDDPISMVQIIQDMEIISITFGAFVISVKRSANEYRVLVYFGLPRKEEKPAYKACRAALEALKKYPTLRQGIATGTVFFGWVGDSDSGHYAVCGTVEERTKELCALARPGEIITDRHIQREMRSKLIFQLYPKELQPAQMKTARIYRLTGTPASSRLGLRDVFVGREKEMAKLETLISKCCEAGDNLAIWVCGEPGIGKTRLVAELLKRVPASPASIFSLWCDLPSSQPLEPIRQLFRQLFQIDPNLSDEAATDAFRALWSEWARQSDMLANLESLIGAILGLRWPGSLLELTSPELRLEKILEAGVLVLKELAARQRLIVNIDDLQWIDSQSRLFFQRLGSAKSGGICILATTRYLEDGCVPALELDNFSAHRIDLADLGIRDSLKLHKSLLGVASLPQDSIKLLKESKTGNPFAIEQMIALCLEKSVINDRGEFDIPQEWKRYKIQDVLLQRIDGLTAKTREYIYNASVLGMRFNIKVLSQMLNSNGLRQLDSGTKNKIWKDLDEVFYIFSHILFQEAAYSRILSEDLPKLHLSAAQAMEKVFEFELSEHAEEIAQHYEKAGRMDRAAHYCDLAADHNWGNSFFEPSETNLRKAVSLSATACGTDSPEYCEYLFHLALLLHYLQRYQEAEPLYLEVMQLARNIHGPRANALSPYLNNLGRFYKDTARYAKGEKLLKRSLAIERKLDPKGSNVADRINNLGHLHLVQKQFKEAEPWFLEALRIMEENYDPGHFFTGTVCGNLGGIYLHLGKLGKARTMLSRSLDICTKYWGPDHPMVASVLLSLGKLSCAQKSYGKAETLYLRGLAILRNSFGEQHRKTLGAIRLLKELSETRGDSKKVTYYSAWLEEG